MMGFAKADQRGVRADLFFPTDTRFLVVVRQRRGADRVVRVFANDSLSEACQFAECRAAHRGAGTYAVLESKSLDTVYEARHTQTVLRFDE